MMIQGAKTSGVGWNMCMGAIMHGYLIGANHVMARSVQENLGFSRSPDGPDGRKLAIALVKLY